MAIVLEDAEVEFFLVGSVVGQGSLAVVVAASYLRRSLSTLYGEDRMTSVDTETNALKWYRVCFKCVLWS